MAYNTKLKIFILLIFLFAKITRSYEFLPIGMEHVPLMIDICKLYGLKSIIVLYAESIKEMEMTTMIFKWTRALSREGFATTNLYFSELQRSSYFMGRILQPLYVVVISNYQAINEFSLATSTFDMSYPLWLVIFFNKGHGSDYCHNPPGNIFHLKFNTEMLVLCGTENILSEWYSINTNRTYIDYLGTWNSNKGTVQLVPKSIYERRKNLQGLAMNTVVVKDSPLLEIQEDGKFVGVFGRILTELCTTLNFSFYVVSEVEEYGNWNRNENTWSGATGEVYSGRADISISDFTMSSARLNVVDFSFPLIISKNALFFREPYIFAVKWSTYFLTFTYPVWITIFLILMASSILLIFLKIKIGTDRNLMHLGSDTCIEVLGILCQQALKDFPRRTSLKIAYFSILVLSTVLSAAYAASLMSILTSAIHTLPFSSLETFVEDGTYQYFVYRGSTEYGIFMNSDNPLKNKLMKLMLKEDKMPTSLLDTFNMICENPKLIVYIYDKVQDDLTFDLPCDVVSVNAGGIESLSIILSKHNAFTGIINFYLQKFFHYGMVNRFKNTMYKKKFQQPIQKHISISIACVISLIFFILIGIVLSICILFMEKYIHTCKMKKQLVVNLVPSIK